MKKLLLFLNLSLISCSAWAQNLPYISTPTVIPGSPTSTDVIKIITKVITPNQSIIVDQTTFSVTQNPKEINIRACYWGGMLPATQTFIDTLVIGQLGVGTYAIKQKAYLSSGQQICHPTDSNLVTLNLIVANITGIDEEKTKKLKIFPNPAADKLYISENNFLTAFIYSSDGRLLKNIELKEKTEIDIRDFAKGFYFMRLTNKDKEEMIKFIKM